MKDDRRRTPLVDPTAEGTALHGGFDGARRGPGPEPARDHDTDDVMNRNAHGRYDTPRRYENEQENVTRPSKHSMLHTTT